MLSACPHACPHGQRSSTHTEQWSGPGPFLHGGPGGALEARRGSAGGQPAQSFELLAGFFSGEKGAGIGQSAGFTCFNELINRLSTENVLTESSSSPNEVAGLWARERGRSCEASAESLETGSSSSQVLCK